MPADNKPFRLLIDPPHNGATNMALDETLLEHVGAARVSPTLRLYRWNPPTISLGYFQHFREYQELPPPAGELPVVRRLTGGGAILHDLELTYSIAVPVRHELLQPGATSLYRTMHDVILRALHELGVRARRRGDCREDSFRRGPFFCFSRLHCEDLVLDRGKLVGSAQRRTHTGVLQHGSIILDSRYPQQQCATAGLAADEEQFQCLTDAVASAFVKGTEMALFPGHWSHSETHSAKELAAKYRSPQWNQRR